MAEEEFELSDCRKKYVDANLFQYNSHGPKTSIGWKNCKVSMKCCKCSFLSSAANNSASNMIKHYQTKHPLIKLNISSKKRSFEEDVAGTSRGGQQSIYDFTFKKSRPEKKILSAITDYIVEDIFPFSTIEKPGLKKNCWNTVAKVKYTWPSCSRGVSRGKFWFRFFPSTPS